MFHLIHSWFDSPEWVLAICHTLLHSLWQGALLAMLAALGLMAFKKATAQRRYQVLLLALLGFAACAMLTFVYEWRVMGSNTAADVNIDPFQAVQTPLATPLSAASPAWSDGFQLWLDTLLLRLDAHAHWIVAIWWVVLCLKGARIGLGIWYVDRIRRFRSNFPARQWQQRLLELSAQMGLRQKVDLLEAALIQVPSAVGFFKPAILLPLGLLAQLPPEQVEAILLHELAHIRRKDYLVNFLQCLLEILFFFNPALWWISARIREEREHCCDDMAVAALQNKTQYINALVAFQEYHLGATAPALAFSGRKMHLLERVTHLLHPPHTKTLSMMEKISLIASIAAIALLSCFPFGHTNAQNKPKTDKNTIRQMNVMGEGTAAEPQVIMVQEEKGRTIVAKRVDNKVQELYVNGEKVEAARQAEFDGLLAYVDETIAEDRAQAERDAEQAKRDAEQAKRDAAQAKLDAEQAKRDAAQAKMDADQAERDQKQSVLDREQARRDEHQAKLDAEQAARDREQAKRDARQAKLDAEQAARDREQALRDAKQAEKDAYQAKLDAEQAKRDAKQAEEDMRVSKLIIASLVADKVIKSDADFRSLILSDTDLVVNGKKQDDALHQKYKSQYLRSPDQVLSFSRNAGRRSQ